jgi:hypothetical protein
MPTFSFFRVSADPYSRALSASGKLLCGLIFEFVASVALVCLALSCSQIARAACSPAAANNVNATCTGATIGQYGSGTETNGTVTVSPAATLTGLGADGRVIYFGSLTSVNNNGSITAAPAGNPGTNVTSYAVTAQFGSATVINYANGTINSTAAGLGSAYGVFAGTDATVSNRSNTFSISARAFTNQAYGIYSANSSTVSSNSGIIQAESDSASASGVSGGVVTVSATDLNSTISGKSNSASGFGLNATTSASVTSNSGTIRGDSTSGNGYGIYSTGGISVTSNALTGLIAGTSNSGGSRGVFARTDVSIASNAGTISGTSTGATGIGNAHGLRSQIGSVTAVNTGTINASTLSADAASASAIWAATFATVTNTGTNAEISATTQGIGGAAYGIRSGTANLTINANEGTIYTRSASGGSYGGYNDGVGANIVVNNNSGSIYARSGSGITAGLYSANGSVSVVSNDVNGKIFAESSNSTGYTTGLRAANSVTIGENKGEIYGSGGGAGSVFGVYAGTSTSIANLSSGRICATNATGTGTAYGIRSKNAATTIDNGGAISASSKNGWSYGIYLVAGAESITNSGSISGGTVGIYTGATVKNLSNYQGGDGTSASNRALTYQGVLPTNYDLFVSSDTHFAQTNFINPSGSMAVGINPGSTLAVGTYASVFQGVDSTSVTGGTGTSGLIKWSLSMADLNAKKWDLVVSNNLIEANTVRNASAIGVTFLPIFTGGTLLVDSANASYSTNFSLDNTASNTIDLGEKLPLLLAFFQIKQKRAT